jgi:hypothetical protein
MAPTTDSRLGVISTQAGLTALGWASVGGASTVPTGPLMASLCAAAQTLSSGRELPAPVVQSPGNRAVGHPKEGSMHSRTQARRAIAPFDSYRDQSPR